MISDTVLPDSITVQNTPVRLFKYPNPDLIDTQRAAWGVWLPGWADNDSFMGVLYVHEDGRWTVRNQDDVSSRSPYTDHLMALATLLKPQPKTDPMIELFRTWASAKSGLPADMLRGAGLDWSVTPPKLTVLGRGVASNIEMEIVLTEGQE